MADEIGALLSKKKYIKTRITKHETFINKAEQDKDVDKFQIKTKLAQLDECHKELQQLRLAVYLKYSSDEDEAKAEEADDDFEMVESKYYSIKYKFQECLIHFDEENVHEPKINISQLSLANSAEDEGNIMQSQIKMDAITNQDEIQEQAVPPIQSGLNQVINTNSKNSVFQSRLSETQNNRNQSHVQYNYDAPRLPSVSLPSFDGRLDKWLQFRDTFTALVINNPRARDDVTKLNHLIGCLKDDALKVIDKVELSEKGFLIAWTTLCNRYNNTRTIIDKHVSELFRIKPVSVESSLELRRLIDEFGIHLRALKSMDAPVEHWSLLIVHMISHRLDNETMKVFETFVAGESSITWDETINFLEKRCRILESVELNTRSSSNVSQKSRFSSVKISTSNTRTMVASNTNHEQRQCCICSGKHDLFVCSQFLKMPVQKRFEKVQENNLCFNCLKHGHSSKVCNSGQCKHCRRKHNSLLHFQGSHTSNQSESTNETISTNQRSEANVKVNQIEATKPESNQTQSGYMTHCTHCNHESTSIPSTEVMLATAVVRIKDNYGEFQFCRALLDNASHSNFVTNHIVQSFRLKTKAVSIPVTGLNESKTYIKSKVNSEIRSRLNDSYSHHLKFLVVPRITGNLPTQLISTSSWHVPVNVELADPRCHIPGKIDMLLGAGIYSEIVSANLLKLGKGLPILQETSFGWIVSGNCQPDSTSKIITNYCHLSSTDESIVQDQLCRFWELEECQHKKRSLTQEEKYCESNFENTTTRNDTGRYIVTLPLRSNANQLSDNKPAATKRLIHLNYKLSKEINTKKMYHEFLDEFEKLNHMEKVNESTDKTQAITYYLPHHGILKPTSSTTKLRVVFDGSSKGQSGLSLNDILSVGPTVQEELLSIMMRFRKHRYAFTADIEKMYRQIEIHHTQTDMQRILWNSNEQDQPISYRLRTVTYGTSSAPYLATRCLQQLSKDESQTFPNAAKILSTDFYVDDCISGHHQLQEAKDLQQELIKLLASAGLKIRKWCANSVELLHHIKEEDREQQVANGEIITNKTIKTLGLFWDTIEDQLCYKYLEPAPKTELTKRFVLSEIARLFDPLGLLSPVTVLAKIIMQEIWKEKLNWDDLLSNKLSKQWTELSHSLNYINHIKIKRHIVINNSIRFELHGYADASIKAYGACIYIKTEDSNGECMISLVCSKSKVAPLKATSLPRLELCAAALLSNLVHKVITAMRIDFNSINLWSDSTITLAWIATPSNNLKTFVANRVAEIQELTHSYTWRHVRSEHNPADIISRGSMPQELEDTQLWWCGPKYLKENEANWPTTTIKKEELPELKTVLASIVNDIDFMTRYSSFKTLIRITAYVNRFIHNCRSKIGNRKNTLLTSDELIGARHLLIKIVQQKYFNNEIKQLKLNTSVDNKSSLKCLKPFLDSNNMLRVGGRLQNSICNYDQKHPLLLPRSCHLVKLIVQSAHIDNGHAGPQALHSILLQEYWIIRCKDIIRHTTRSCITCIKVNPKHQDQFMADLPLCRVQLHTAFENTGVDYCGPFLIRSGGPRSRSTCKAYIALFVCMATKAVHVEVVTSLTTQAFIAALQRFVARRNRPKTIYSDNGKNFVGANNEFTELHNFMTSEEHNARIFDFCANDRISWKFIPPRAPHFGGLWEAAVKSFKYHFKRIVGTITLSFEEITTISCRIESMLNSRPLTPESDNPEDLRALTPGHFLVLSPFKGIMENDWQMANIKKLTRWQLLQKLSQDLWNRWMKEYLSTLQRRSKNYLQIITIKLNMMVLVKDENTAPLYWPLGRIVKLHAGKDNIVRVVSIRIQRGIIIRAVSKIVLLPVETPEVSQGGENVASAMQS